MTVKNRCALFGFVFSVFSPLFCETEIEQIKHAVAQIVAQGDVQYEDKRSVENDDMEALRRWLNDKRMITVKELGGDLSLSGEVRFEFQNVQEKIGSREVRGVGKAKPAQVWDVEVNLILDYRTDYTWATIKLEFDNDAGTGSGVMNKIRLETAYLGGRIVAGDTFTFDAEAGRRYMSKPFDSKIEFGALFDGVLFRFNKAFISIADFYCNVAGFLVDERTNHYGAAVEMGGLRIANTGFGAKYSVIDWWKQFDNPQKNDRFHFVVQQALLFYQFNPEWLWKKLVKVYAAALNNIIANDLVLATSNTNSTPINFGKQNWGWYVGLAIGQAKKAGDFAVEVDYQWVQAQTVADYDFSGIGRGNSGGAGLYTTAIDGSNGIITNAKDAVGPCNYKGWEVDFLYLFTNNISMDINFKMSNTLDKKLGGNRRFNQFETEFIYAF